jgi:hypothetical protein
MAAKKVKVVYLDGRSEEATISPRAQVMTESYVGGFSKERAILAIYYSAWAALNKAGKVTAGFDEWLDTIDDVEDVDEPEPVPTVPAESAGDSSE